MKDKVATIEALTDKAGGASGDDDDIDPKLWQAHFASGNVEKFDVAVLRDMCKHAGVKVGNNAKKKTIIEKLRVKFEEEHPDLPHYLEKKKSSTKKAAAAKKAPAKKKKASKAKSSKMNLSDDEAEGLGTFDSEEEDVEEDGEYQEDSDDSSF